MAARKSPELTFSDRVRRWPLGRIAAGLTSAILLTAIGRVTMFEDPGGGRPLAISPIELQSPVSPDAEPGPLTANRGESSAAPAPDAEVFSGPPAAVSEPAPTLSPEERLAAELSEETRFGSVPRISAKGVTPFETYRRPPATPAPTGPMVALVVSGLGMNLDTALNTVTTLPPEVSLAFTSYATTLDQSAGAALAAGHEIYLEVPLEPFDYPANDPGPDTLLLGQPPRDNLDRLLKVMSAFHGYAGMMNVMGARFTASAPDFGPVLEELAGRGLAYLDDGSSNRSLAEQLATSRRMPFAKVDTVIDTAPSHREILAALDALEQCAKTKGRAIGMLSGLPISVTLVSEWLKSLPQKGITLVPVSMLMKGRNAKP